MTLTSEHGLENWTLRQLASGVGAYPAVIYHHVGDREAVVAAVIERVVGEWAVPAEELPWREWFDQLLTQGRPVLRRHPGVARRVALHGPLVQSAHRIIDPGVRVLQGAGFGDDSVPVYTLLLNAACMFVALEDDRETKRGRPVERDPSDLPGLVALVSYLDRADLSDEFAYSIARTLDGVAARLATLHSGPHLPYNAFSSVQVMPSATEL